MKSPGLNLIKVLFFVLTVFAIQACTTKPGVWHDEQISAGNRKDFHAMNDQVLKALRSGNMNDTLKAFLAKERIDDVAGTNRQIELISNQLKTGDFTLLNEYYLIRDTLHADSVIKIQSAAKRKNAYSLSSVWPAGKNYIALFVSKNANTPDKYIIGITYFKYEYGWKISDLDLGPYTINGKTSPELYDEAKQEYDKKYFINALNTMQLANSCLRPVATWSYPQENAMGQLSSLLLTAANYTYKFPLVVAQVPTHPKIFRIMNKDRNNGMYPMIYYQSSIKLNDTAGLKKENEQIQRVIGSIMPGIDKDKKYLIYAAYNEMPNPDKSPEHFEITQKIGQ